MEPFIVKQLDQLIKDVLALKAKPKIATLIRLKPSGKKDRNTSTTYNFCEVLTSSTALANLNV